MNVVKCQDKKKRKTSGKRIVIAGTGGQGVLTIARLLCDICVAQGHQVVSGQLHGMAQRNGAVQSSVMIDCGISPVIGRGRADFVLGLEPVETARALPLMSSHTVVYMNTTPLIPFTLGQRFVMKQGDADYPDVEKLSRKICSVTPYLFPFDATEIAHQVGSVQTLNIVMLGCLLGSGLLPCDADDFWNTVAKKMPPKFAEANSNAFLRGVQLGESFQLSEEGNEAQNWH